MNNQNNHQQSLESWEGVSPQQLVCSMGGLIRPGSRDWEDYHKIYNIVNQHGSSTGTEIAAQIHPNRSSKEHRRWKSKGWNWLRGKYAQTIKAALDLHDKNLFQKDPQKPTLGEGFERIDMEASTAFDASNKHFEIMTLTTAFVYWTGCLSDADQKKIRTTSPIIEVTRDYQESQPVIDKLLDGLTDYGWWNPPQETNHRSANSGISRLIRELYGGDSRAKKNHSLPYPLPVLLALESIRKNDSQLRKAEDIISDFINVFMITRMKTREAMSYLGSLISHTNENVRDERVEIFQRMLQIAEYDDLCWKFDPAQYTTTKEKVHTTHISCSKELTKRRIRQVRSAVRGRVDELLARF